MFFLICLILGIIVLSCWLLLHRRNQYWNGKSIPVPEPSLLFGNYADYFLLRKNLGDNVAAISAQFPNSPLIGTYFGTEPALIVKDPDLLRLVFTKDFYYFNSRELADHIHKEPFFTNLFNEANDEWRALRQAFNPLFSPAKMKNMFYLVHRNTIALRKYMAEQMKVNSVQKVKDFTARFTIDCIASCVFGYEGKTLDNSPNASVFKEIADEVVNFTTTRQLKYILRQVWPSVFYATGQLASQKPVEIFFTHLLQSAFKDRNYTPGSRNDFVDYLLSIRSNGFIIGDNVKNMNTKGDVSSKVQLKITDAMLVAQCMAFFGAGFETSATTMEFMLFELAKHPDVLERVLLEVDDYLSNHGSEVTYECINELPYLEACVDETMRKYAVLGAVTREVVEEYVLPSGLVLPKGMRVFVPTYHIHNHPDYFPDPEKFKPERFLGKNRSTIKPYSYIPFGEGPRICIGKRFARMQSFAGLVTILRDYRVALPIDQPQEITFEPLAFVTMPTTAIRLQFIPRNILPKPAL